MDPYPIDTGKPLAVMARCSFFADLTGSELAAIYAEAAQRRFPAGSFIFNQGETAVAFYVILSGRVRLSQVTAEGHQVIVHFFGPGKEMGIVAVLENAVYPAGAEVVEASVLLSWDQSTITQLTDRYPRLARNALRMLANRFCELQDRYRELATERVERRVARTLLRLARQGGRKVTAGILIDMPLSRRDLAEMTGTTLYTVSRILSGWEQKGMLKTGREQIIICSSHRLVAVAEDLPKAQK